MNDDRAYSDMLTAKKIAGLEELLKIAELTLEFYANSKKYCDDNPHGLSSMGENTCTVLMDGGFAARVALKHIKGTNEKET